MKKAPFETEFVVYVNYLSDTLTLHFFEGSHTIKLRGTDSHSNDLGEIWEQGIYGFKTVTHISIWKKTLSCQEGQSYLLSSSLDNPKETVISPVLI